MSTNGLRKFNHHPSGMKESFLGDYYYDTEVDAFIRTQQATIERLTDQRDRLLDALKDLESATRHFHPCLATMEKVKALIAEIEASND